MDNVANAEVVADLKRMWAKGARPSELLRSLTSRGLRGAPIIVVMQLAFELPLSRTNAITAWFSHEDDERVDRHLLPHMPARAETSDHLSMTRFRQITFCSVRAAVLADQMDPALLELRAGLVSGEPLEEVGSGTIDAGEALAMFELRRRTTGHAGVAFAGVEQLLARLRGKVGSVSLFHFRNAHRVFTVVVDAATGSLVGCASVPRRIASGDDGPVTGP